MVHLKIFNDDTIRVWNYFPPLREPECFNKSLLRIFNEVFSLVGFPEFSDFNKLYKFAIDTNFNCTYFSVSNFNAWGSVPFVYAYNDMIRLIQNVNSPSNFCMTLESLTFDIDEVSSPNAYNTAIDVTNLYISENYLSSYNYMQNNNTGVMTVTINHGNYIISYIVAVGFHPYAMSKWFSTGRTPSDLPYSRYLSLRGIMLGISKIHKELYFDKVEPNVSFEAAEGRLREDPSHCENWTHQFDLAKIKKKSFVDTEVKFGNMSLDYNILEVYDSARPGVYLSYTDSSGCTTNVNRFNYEPEDGRMDYNILKKQNNMIKIDEKRKAINNRVGH